MLASPPTLPADLARHRAARHKNRPLQVVQRLQKDVTDGVERRVQPQRQTDAHNLAQGSGIKAAGQNRQRKLCAAAANVKNAAYPRQKQCNRRGCRHAADAKAERTGKHKIQYDVGGAADKQQQQRGRAVAYAAQKTGVEVIAHVAQNTQHRDAQIQHRPRHGVRRDLHQPQHPRPQQKPDDGQRQRRCKQQPDRGAHELLQLVMVGAADSLRYEDGDARADAHKDTEQNFERLGAGRHRGQRRSVAEIADDERVHRAVQQLQNIAGADGQRKQRRAPQHGAVGHINLCGFSVSRHSPIPRYDRFSYLYCTRKPCRLQQSLSFDFWMNINDAANNFGSAV